MRPLSTGVRALALLGLALALLSACGQRDPAAPAADRPATDSPATESRAADAPTTDAPATDDLRLGLTEWSIETGGVALRPGEVQVRVTNTGGTGHDVVIHGEEGTWATPVLGPGETYDLVITTVAGEELHLVCTLTGHDAQGMHTRIDVEDGG